MQTPIYFDYCATCPIDERVLNRMLSYMGKQSSFGNPASSAHRFGWEAKEAVEHARAQVADLINASPQDIIFTSGATEANNLAIIGIAENYGGHGKHIITSQTEHKAVLDPCMYLARQAGFDITYLTPQADGRISLQELKEAIRDDTLLVSIMHANNETGTVQDIAAIDAICQDHDLFFHIDAAQSAGKLPIDTKNLQADLISISAHKLYGPKGIGALFVRDTVKLAPQIHGGGHENGYRSGTLATHQIVGLGTACAIAKQDFEQDTAHLRAMRQRLLTGLKTIPAIVVNGSSAHHLPNNLNISVGYVKGENLLKAIKLLAVSSGAACISATNEPSYVLTAMGVSPMLAHSSIRFSVGRDTTEEDVDFAIEYMQETISSLRSRSPHWQALQEAGTDPSSLDSNLWLFYQP